MQEGGRRREGEQDKGNGYGISPDPVLRVELEKLSSKQTKKTGIAGKKNWEHTGKVITRQNRKVGFRRRGFVALLDDQKASRNGGLARVKKKRPLLRQPFTPILSRNGEKTRDPYSGQMPQLKVGGKKVQRTRRRKTKLSSQFKRRRVKG